MQYQITASLEQMTAIFKALEIYTRLHTGNWKALADEHICRTDKDRHNLLIERMVRAATIVTGLPDGNYRQITDEHVAERARVAYDLWQVLYPVVVPDSVLAPDGIQVGHHEMATVETIEKSSLDTYRPISPGEYIQDFLECRGFVQLDLLEKTNIPLETIVGLIQGKTMLTPTIAAELEKYFDVSAEMWLDLEIRYRKDLFRIADRNRIDEVDDD